MKFLKAKSDVMTVTASASSNRLNAYIWLRRVGNPGTGTLELQSDNAAKPSGTVLKSDTVTTSDVTDIISVFQWFTWTAQAVTSGTTYHLVFYGASTDDDKNHWEVGVDVSGNAGFYKSSQFSGDGTATDFSMYYRLTDADIDRKWWFFYKESGTLCKVSNESSSTLYTWDETNDVWTAVAPATHLLNQVTGRPIESNNFIYFPQGDSTAIRVWNGSSTWDSQTIASGQGCAYGLAVGYSAADNKMQIWRFNNALVSGGTTTGRKSSVSRADAVTVITSDLAFRNFNINVPKVETIDPGKKITN